MSPRLISVFPTQCPKATLAICEWVLKYPRMEAVGSPRLRWVLSLSWLSDPSESVLRRDRHLHPRRWVLIIHSPTCFLSFNYASAAFSGLREILPSFSNLQIFSPWHVGSSVLTSLWSGRDFRVVAFLPLWMCSLQFWVCLWYSCFVVPRPTCEPQAFKIWSVEQLTSGFCGRHIGFLTPELFSWDIADMSLVRPPITLWEPALLPINTSKNIPTSF